ncbi:MAG: malonyl-CoA decarboxylase family protein [Acidobacteriota bacterium]
MPREERPWFFEAILRRLEVGKPEIEKPMVAALTCDGAGPAEWGRMITDVRRAVESPRLRAFRRFLNVSGGFKFLLDLRANVITAQAQSGLDLQPLDEELSHLFNSWFQGGFLFLQEISRDSSFRQIRFLKEHDMVHPMASLDEIWHRLGRDRRCFALYHRAMPEEPVVFIESALTRGMPRSIDDILRGEQDPAGRKRRPDTVAFYSINNTQDGLAGLGLGTVMIAEVVEAIRKVEPGIKTFCTLSPIPGFWRRYLEPLLEGQERPVRMTGKRLWDFFPENVRAELLAGFARLFGRRETSPARALVEILSNPRWISDSGLAGALRWPLCEIAYFYLKQERDRQGKRLNPVANFHMGNGATVSLLNIHFAANRSERGLMDSCGLMVNYVYPMGRLHRLGRRLRSLL